LFGRLHHSEQVNGRAASIWIFSDGLDLKFREEPQVEIRKPIRQLSEDEVSNKIKNLLKFYSPLIKGGFTINTFGFGEKSDDFLLSQFAKYGNSFLFFWKKMLFKPLIDRLILLCQSD
jgi:hypothetical protein